MKNAIHTPALCYVSLLSDFAPVSVGLNRREDDASRL